MPRLCAIQYNRARDRLLENPAKRENWAALADLCDALDRRLALYAAKPGSDSRGRLSFAAEGQFARDVLEGGTWDRLKEITGP